jgi:hypothetical protein
MHQSRSVDPLRTVRVITQRAIALAVLGSGCVCEDALMSYSAPTDVEPVISPPTPPDSSTSTSFAIYAMPDEWASKPILEPPTRIEVVPVDVSALVGLQFEMRARLFDANGVMIPILDDGQIEWSVAPATGIEVTPVSPGRVMVQVNAQNGLFTLTALHSVYGFSTKATIKSVQLEGSTAVDWIAGTHDSREPPMLALVDGTWSPNFENDKLFAFVGGGSLGTIVDCLPPSCGEATVFATKRSLDRQSFSWTSMSCDLVDRRTGPPVLTTCPRVFNGALNAAIDIPTRIWAYSPTATTALITADLGFIKNALRDAWGGAMIAETIEQTGDTRVITLDFTADGVTCAASVFTKLIDEFQITGLAPDRATIVLVDNLFRRASNGSSELYWTGYACPYDALYGAVAFVDWRRKSLTTTSHEVGHVIGPWDSNDNWGHMEIVSAPKSNLMFGTQEAVDFPRWTLTLGQVYRFSLDRDAIIRRGIVPSTLDRCPVITPAGSKCPSITKDVP